MSYRPLIPLLVAAALGAGAPPDDDPKPTGDLARLQGKWKADLGDGRGSISMRIQAKVVEMTMTGPDGEQFVIKGEVRLDESADPKHWDYVDGKSQPGDQPVADALAIYQLEGDTLRLGMGDPPAERPDDFESGEVRGVPRTLLFRRQPDEPAPKPGT